MRRIMIELILATAIFFASHVIPAHRPLRDALIERLGPIGYQIFYGAISLATIAWLIIAFISAPRVELWTAQTWMLWTPYLIMPFACILLVAGSTSLNPFSVGRGSEGFDPARPGIVSVTRHPLMWGLALWAASHIPPNGEMADMILFSMLLVLSLFGPFSLDHKRRAKLGAEEWRKLAQGTSNFPLAAILSGLARLDWKGIGWKRLAAGLLLYTIILLSHETVIGELPTPW